MHTAETQALELGDIPLQYRHLRAADAVGRKALEVMNLCYSGLAYHNASHPRAVKESAKLMMHALGVSMLGRVAGEAAALSHDIVQCKPRGVMERESAEWFEGQLKRKFPKQGIETGRLAILGTEPIAEGGKIVGQMASRLVYPSLEAEKVALSVASGDMGGEMFSPLGPLRGHMLYKELQGVHDPARNPSWEGFADFQDGQIPFTSDYRFPHPMGETVLGALRGSVVAYHEQLSADVYAGKVDSWEQVLARDLAFAREHGDSAH